MARELSRDKNPLRPLLDKNIKMTGERWMASLKFLTLAISALILVPSAAHLFELPGKIDLDRDADFMVQGIYQGWSLFGRGRAERSRGGGRRLGRHIRVYSRRSALAPLDAGRPRSRPAMALCAITENHFDKTFNTNVKGTLFTV
jgi:hypothetical protein